MHRLAFLMLCMLVGCSKTVKTVDTDLVTARQGFETSLRVSAEAPDSKGDALPPSGVNVVTYQSSNYDLKAFQPPTPEGDEKRPAVVFLHSGFALWEEDWEYAQPYLDAGFVVIMPSTRGDCGNPGVFEAFFGEVDDVVAAGEYAQSLPYVNPDQVFVAGHSAGGVLALLSVMRPSPYRAAASIDPSLDMEEWAVSNPPEYVVFDRYDPQEVLLRNPLAFIGSIQCEIFLYSEPEYLPERRFARECEQKGKQCILEVLQGDHNSIVPEAQVQIVRRFRGIVAGDKQK